MWKRAERRILEALPVYTAYRAITIMRFLNKNCRWYNRVGFQDFYPAMNYLKKCGYIDYSTHNGVRHYWATPEGKAHLVQLKKQERKEHDY